MRAACAWRGVRVGNWPRHTYLTFPALALCHTYDLNLAMIEHQRETRLARDLALSFCLLNFKTDFAIDD